MGRTALVTVPDEGAAWVVRDALAAGGVPCETERVRLAHPYTASALAREMRIFVDDAHLVEARRLLAGLEGEVANHDEELTAEAMAAGRPTDEHGAKEVQEKPEVPSLTLALAMGLLLPVPAVCLSARANRLGLLFLAAFVVGLVYGPLSIFGFSSDEESDDLTPAGLIAPAAKVADLVVGIPLVIVRRRRAARQS
jgi:hypothetical protein